MLNAYRKLQQNTQFRSWKEKNKKSHLSHIFAFYQEPLEFQIGYSDSDAERITSFTVRGSSVKKSKAEEIFKKPGARILPLTITKVKVQLDKAVEKALELQQRQYRTHGIVKKIAILQHLPVGQVYNITFVTNTFHTLNVKVDASNGKIRAHKLTSLFDFAKKS